MAEKRSAAFSEKQNAALFIFASETGKMIKILNNVKCFYIFYSHSQNSCLKLTTKLHFFRYCHQVVVDKPNNR